MSGPGCRPLSTGSSQNLGELLTEVLCSTARPAGVAAQWPAIVGKDTSAVTGTQLISSLLEIDICQALAQCALTAHGKEREPRISAAWLCGLTQLQV